MPFRIISNFKFQISNFKSEVSKLDIGNWKLKIENSWRSQAGVSSMIMLVFFGLLILLWWEGGQYIQNFIDAGGGNSAPAIARPSEPGCIGSNTKFDCFDQDEGTDFVDN